MRSLPRAVALLAAMAALTLTTATSDTAWATAMKPQDKPAKPAAKTPAATPAAPAKPAAPTVSATGMPLFDTTARHAIVVDFDSGATLLDKDADQRMPTASMSKIMTAYQVYLYLREGRVKLDDMLPVSEKAWRTQGSKMFVPYPGQVKVEDLLRGMIIQSGNDACVVLAEGLAGSVEAFVEQMNATAKKLGLTNSHFANVDGLPDPNHYMSPRDLAALSRHLITDFPQFYKFEAEKEFTYNGIKQGNRNPLLYKDLGADGIKTGHTDEAGFSLVGSAVRNGRRVIFVLGGMQSMNDRATESERVLEWAYREFEDVTVAKAGAPVDDAPVWLGVDATVKVAPGKDAIITIPRAQRKAIKISAVYNGPIPAPIAQGAEVGLLTVTAPTMAPVSIPLVAMNAVDRLGPIGRATSGIIGYVLEKKN